MFTHYFKCGYTDLCSVTPANAQLAENSKIDKRHLGKAPGVQQPNGKWRGDPNFLKRKATLDYCAQWDKTDANVGLQAAHFPGLDIDVMDPALSVLIAQEALQFLGWAPVRVGKPPKQLLLYRLSGAPFSKKVLTFFAPDGAEHKIEVLADKQQYVIHGTHPEGHCYTFDECNASSLTTVTGEQTQAFLDHIGEVLEAKGCLFGSRTSSSNSSGPVDQERLKGDIALVREAVESIANDFYTREEYLKFAHAIRAACAEDPEQGKTIWLEWTSRWEDGVSDPDYDGATYDSLRAPFKVGAGLIYELARREGWIGEAQADFAGAPPQVHELKEFAAGIPDFSDQALTRRVMRAHGHELRYQPQNGRFLVWDGYRWRPDTHNAADALFTDALGKEAARALGRIENAAKAERYANRCASNAARACVRSLIKSEQRIVLLNDECDADPWQLNTPGGTVDLKTGLVKPCDPRDNHTMSTSVAPAQGEPLLWNTFLDDATAGDFEMIAYLQRLTGYLCTGSTQEHSISFIHGPGGNGKSVFMDTIGKILGDYSTSAPIRTFLMSNSEGHPAEIAALAGARAVFAQETAEGRRWDEGLLKVITGGEPIATRHMYQDFFTFTPILKLVFSGNHKPDCNIDAAMKRRLSLIPFVQTPKKVDPQLSEKLRAEYPQILQWMLAGCQKWLAEGLNPPEKVRQATSEYFEEEDSIGRWIDDHCRRDPLVTTELQMLYSDFSTWAKFNGIRPGSDKRLSRGLVNRGFERIKHTRTRRSVIEGLRLLNETEKATDEFGRDSDRPYDA